MAITALAVAAICLASWALAPTGAPLTAGAHEGSSKLYRSVITGITPASLPIGVQVKGGDDQLRVQNQGDQPLYIYGYENGPTGDVSVDTNYYLRIEPDGVYVNTRSTAYQLNTTRSGNMAMTPPTPGPATWKLVQRSVPAWTFHDHRTHWMGTKPPANVDTGSTKAQQVFTWSVAVKNGNTKGETAQRRVTLRPPGPRQPIESGLEAGRVGNVRGALGKS